MELDISVLENISVNGGRRSDGHQRMSIQSRKQSPCIEDPLTPHFYIVNVGFTWVYMSYFCLL